MKRKQKPGFRMKSANLRKLISSLNWSKQGLIPAVIQDTKSREVLTLCYVNKDALKKSLEEGFVYVYRRSKRRLMLKGETSGHVQAIQELRVDCDGNSILLKVKQHVAGCHAGFFTCYYSRLARSGSIRVVGRRVFNPFKVYKK